MAEDQLCRIKEVVSGTQHGLIGLPPKDNTAEHLSVPSSMVYRPHVDIVIISSCILDMFHYQ